MPIVFESANEYKAIQEAVNQILPCAQVSIVRPRDARYTVTGSGVIQGAGLAVTCVKTATGAFSVMLSWTIPVSREDGTPLQADEISHYLVYSSGKVVEVASTKESLFIDGLSAGEYHFSILTVDTDGLKSKPSSVISTTLL